MAGGGRSRVRWRISGRVAEILHVRYVIVMGLEQTKEAVPHLDEVLDRLVREFKPLRVVLFGSWVRGEQTHQSDIDLLVVAETTGPMNERMARAQRALRGLRTPVDVFVCTPSEVTTYGQWLSHTVAIALREGREVYAS